MNIIWRFTINPEKRDYNSDEDNFINDLEFSKEIWYEYPHYYNNNQVTGYRAAIIQCEDVDIKYIEKIYKIKPNKIYSLNNIKHLIFYFRNSLESYNYNRVTKALAFLYNWISKDYHFYPLNGVIEEFSSDEINENLDDVCTKIYFFQQHINKYQKQFTIKEFDKYLETEKLEIKEVVEVLYEKDMDWLMEILKHIDVKNNISTEYWSPFSFVHHYYSNVEKAKLFFKEKFNIWFEETNSFDYTKSTNWVVIKEWENIHISEHWYFTLDSANNIKKLTDFYIKVHSKIIQKDWKHFFIVSLINQWEWVETNKIIWENKTSNNAFSDFIQSYWPFHYYWNAGYIKELHRQIATTRQVPEIEQVIWYGHHKEEWIIIFQNWVWDIKERLFTKRVDENEDYYYNYNGKWYWVTDNQWNNLSSVLPEWVPRLDIQWITEMDDILNFMQKLYADNTWAYLVFLAFWMFWHLLYWDKTKNFPLIFTRGVTGCVDSETEYLIPTWWKKISDYKEWDIIWEFNKETWKCEFKKPLDYIKEKDDRDAYRIKTKNIDMLLTEEHRVLSESIRWKYSTTQLWEVVSELKKHKHHKTNKYNIPTVFDIEDKKWVDLSDDELRLMVAVIADWSFPKKNKWGKNVCYINIKKQKKIDRLLVLLDKCDIYYEWVYSKPWYSRIRFDAPRNDKIFTEFYWSCSKRQLKIIADEVQYWDWWIDERNWSVHFYTTIKESADFVQYALLVTNQTRTSTQQKKKSTRIEYKDISREKLTDWNKYCFTTSTSYWIARRNWKIFITWNSWKTSFNELLQRIWGVQKAGSDFDNSTVFTMWITLSYLIKFPYFITEYRESASNREQKVWILRNVFDRKAQTKGRADQSVITYNYVGSPVLDWEEMITDWALRTRSLQLQLLKKHKIKWNFNKILRKNGHQLDKILFTYLTKSNWDKYQKFLDEWYDFFEPHASENRIVDNISKIYAWCMIFDSKFKEIYQTVLLEIIWFQEEDVQENSTSMQILKIIAKFLETSYTGVFPLKDKLVISWNILELYVLKYRLKTTLKIETYKEHLLMKWFKIDFVEAGLEEGIIEWVIIPYKIIPKQLLVHPETYKAYKNWQTYKKK